ncbi:alcohol dehydrogenase catalytic domain-containing protein [bacterium]|nr:alcohol dehydrogenase catalytic domain-containing protein [bacterium]
MEAIVITGPGQFEYRDNQAVPEPGTDEIRVRVLGAGICGTDVHITRGDQSVMNMVKPPLVLGHEFCGVIDKTGPGVTGFSKGDYVSAEMHQVCKTCPACADGKYHACVHTKVNGIHCDGAFAEYVVVPAWNVVKLPKSIPIKVASIMDALGNAVHTSSKAPIKGRTVAIVGYGPIGAMASEIAVFLGAAHVFIIDISSQALSRAENWAAKRGAVDKVTLINTHEASLGILKQKYIPEGVDIAYEMSGASGGISAAFEFVRAGGTVSLLGIPKEEDVTIQGYSKNVLWKGLTVHGIIGREMFDTWKQMIGLLEDGLQVEPLITGEFELKNFSAGLSRFRDGKEQKVVLYPKK